MSLLKPVLENLAGRIAISRKGRVYPADLLPWLPVSIELIMRHLDEMVDDAVVFQREDAGLRFYEFSELVDEPPQPLLRASCLYCSADVQVDRKMLTCEGCRMRLEAELMELAEKEAWPTDAVWQHELLFITALADHSIPIADIARRSRLPLKQVKERLNALVKLGCARQVLDTERRRLRYEFPVIQYPRGVYKSNDAFIRRHPSSIEGECEEKFIKILVALIVLCLAAFAVGFVVRIPFPLVLFCTSILSVAVVWAILRHRPNVGEPAQIGGES